MSRILSKKGHIHISLPVILHLDLPILRVGKTDSSLTLHSIYELLVSLLAVSRMFYLSVRGFFLCVCDHDEHTSDKMDSLVSAVLDLENQLFHPGLSQLRFC